GRVEENRYTAGKNKFSINTQSLSSGSYVLLINTGDGVYSHKIVCNK
ncbi:MAG: T9SS type A sorting domain-containing protein, partial [Chitinophagaceae bacterium]|nr:T9SS type A sorting domain-containing protein [Chitinophagaceae bacterium]